MSHDLWSHFRAGRPLTQPASLLDLHGHLGRYHFGIPGGSPATLVAAMDRIGVASIVCSHMQCMSGDCDWGNDQVAEAMRAHPGRILGYASVWPRDRQSVAREIERCFSMGFTGLKVHNSNGFAYDHAAYEPAYAAANERCMPVLFHTWGGDAEFAQIGRIADGHPDASILLAHCGSANTAAYCRMATEHPNVYLDLALSRSPRGLIRELVDTVDSTRIVWGSDAVFLDMAQQLGKVVGADIPEPDKRRILIDNGRQILDRVRA